jgi:hypothetical protein
VLVVVTQREISDLGQVFRIQFHVRSGSHTHPACIRIGSPQRGRDIIAGQMRLVEAPRNVRFGSKADIGACPCDARFTPKSGH